MMFMIPTPATMSEMLAIASRKMLIVSKTPDTRSCILLEEDICT